MEYGGTSAYQPAARYTLYLPCGRAGTAGVQVLPDFPTAARLSTAAGRCGSRRPTEDAAATPPVLRWLARGRESTARSAATATRRGLARLRCVRSSQGTHPFRRGERQHRDQLQRAFHHLLHETQREVALLHEQTVLDEAPELHVAERARAPKWRLQQGVLQECLPSIRVVLLDHAPPLFRLVLVGQVPAPSIAPDVGFDQPRIRLCLPIERQCQCKEPVVTRDIDASCVGVGQHAVHLPFLAVGHPVVDPGGDGSREI